MTMHKEKFPQIFFGGVMTGDFYKVMFPGSSHLNKILSIVCLVTFLEREVS
jgi:hypothetical protein